jgi:Relaxase/Mobilisation nuclease domain/Large polyvalent protein-associated domain 7
MIAKRIELRNMQMSSFLRLVQYITGTQEKHERVGAVRVTNCSNEDASWAAMEAEAVQARNKRSGMDKTYHLLVSFREGDYPAPEVLEAIENRICEKLGYAEHQRVSAVHYDTDHMHIHMAINKIHPKRYTAHEPYFDKRALGVLCEAFEQEYGIEPDNHIPRMTQGEAKAQDMEKASGIESLIGWVKRGVLPEMLAATSWQELHTLMGTHGLTLAIRGNGLVVVDESGIGAKASSISRALSKVVLEKKLGSFQPAMVATVKPTTHYSIKPMRSVVDTSGLWELYQREQRDHKQRYAVLGVRANDRKQRRMVAARKSATLKRSAVRLTKGRLAQSVLYHAIAKSYGEEIQAIRTDYQQDRQAIYAKGKRVAWYDWLKIKSGEGNTQALEVLRRRYERTAREVNAIGGQSANAASARHSPHLAIDTITKRGTIHYQLAKTVLRDDGDRFRLAEGLSNEVIASALGVALQRFGARLSITGTESFRHQVVEVAAQGKLTVSFADPVMEAQLQALQEKPTYPPSETSAEDAMARYINERTATREKGVEILPHRRYDTADAGTHAYAGIRHVEGKTLMLLQTPTEMLVLSIDESTVQRAQHLKIGASIAVKPDGQVRSRARRH